MFNKLKEDVCNANKLLLKYNLVLFNWGNVSQISKDGKYIAIKPSGVDYEKLTPDDIVVVDMNEKIIEGKLKPSVDTKIHIELYKAFSEIKGICHTHSNFATSFAQAGKDISVLGTTHADYFYGDIPCTRALTKKEVENDYEKNTGKVIIETFNSFDYKTLQGVLVKHHGVFTWGQDSKKAILNAVAVEELAKMNYRTLILNPNSKLPKYILDKHYKRIHGDNAYYGQGGK